MKNIEVGYCVRRDGNVILQDVASVKITDRQIPEIAKYILSDVEYQTGELVCVPSKYMTELRRQCTKMLSQSWANGKMRFMATMRLSRRNSCPILF